MRLMISAFAVSLAFGQTNQTFRLTQNENRQDLEEIAMVLRGTGDIQQVSVDDLKGTVAVGGTAGQIAMAEWLVRQMDLPANSEHSGTYEYRPLSSSDDVVRLFYVSHAATPQELQEIATTLRSVGDTPRLFIYNTLNLVAARGTGQQISLAAWLRRPMSTSFPASTWRGYLS
jgi:hypothetical protein